MEQQPFYVGQKVVFIKRMGKYMPTVINVPEVGSIYTVSAVVSHPFRVGDWALRLQELDAKDNYWHRQFAPINPPRVSAIPELLKQPVEETLDVYPVKILAHES